MYLLPSSLRPQTSVALITFRSFVRSTGLDSSLLIFIWDLVFGVFNVYFFALTHDDVIYTDVNVDGVDTVRQYCSSLFLRSHTNK